MSSFFRHLAQGQQNLSRSFDRLLPAEYQVDGNRDFLDHWIEPYLKYGSVVYDVGGGKNPAIGLGEKLLKNQRGDIRLTAVDVLNQNQSVNRTVTGNYIQDAENRTLKPYVMLTFTYTMR